MSSRCSSATSPRSTIRSVSFVIVCVAVAVVYVWFAGREFWATSSAHRDTVADLEEAVRWEPSNAEYHDKLGHLLEVTTSVKEAEQQYRAAVQLNPHVARYWFDEATISKRNGDLENERHAIEHAIQADPRTPDVAWRAANFYLMQGNTDEALHLFRTVLEGDENMAPPVLDTAWRATHDVDRLLAVMVPHETAPHLAFLDMLASYHETSAAEQTWAHLMQMRHPFDPRLGLPYINYLIEQREITPALAAWDQLATLNHEAGYLPSENLIVNGGFDTEILNGGFDWRYSRQPGVGLSLDDTTFHGGHRALAITFQGPGVDEIKIFHFIPVAPNSTYDFSSYFRTSDLEGAGAPRIVITDGYSERVYFTSDDLKNTEVWRQTNGTFTTAAEAKLAVLKIMRVPEGRPIRGTLWLDDVELTKK